MAKGQATSLTNLDTFGDVAAEDDAVLNYFLATNAVEIIDENKAFLVLGRKGAGKNSCRIRTSGVDEDCLSGNFRKQPVQRHRRPRRNHIRRNTRLSNIGRSSSWDEAALRASSVVIN